MVVQIIGCLCTVAAFALFIASLLYVKKNRPIVLQLHTILSIFGWLLLIMGHLIFEFTK